MDKNMWMLIGIAVIGFGLVTVIFGFGNIGSSIGSLISGGGSRGYGQVGCGMMGGYGNSQAGAQAGNGGIACAGSGAYAQGQQAGNGAGAQAGNAAGNTGSAQQGGSATGNAGGAVQDVYIKALPTGSYDKTEVHVKAGVPVRLHFTAEQGSGCGALFILDGFGIQLTSLNAVEQVATFTPTTPGTYEYHCGMHMFVGRMIVE